MTDNTKKPKDVTVAKAKGRPLLTWVGKKPLGRVKAYPAQAVERFDATGGQPLPLQAVDWSDWPNGLPHSGLLYHGDNKDVLAHLLVNGFRGKVKLIYIDPPFDSAADYVRKVELRGDKAAVKIEGEDYTLGEQVQYSDIWANDNYLQFMYERLLMLRELLSGDGVVVLHCDWRKSHQLRVILDEVFGPECFQNEVYWYFYNKMHDIRKQILPRATNTLLAYRKGDEGTFHRLAVPRSEVVKQLKRVKVNGVLVNLKDESGDLVYQDSDSKTLDNVWAIPLIPPADKKQKTDYPTQKPEALLEVVIQLYTDPGDIVLDSFIGSGTTAVASQRWGRRWIGCDINKGAIQTTAKRIQDLMTSQASVSGAPSQGDLIARESEAPLPSQLAFSTYRVNDYDLQIQHNEAVELACQHLGVTRTRTDPYFDGTQGGRLVKIVPFNHPLTPLDLEALRTELKTRPTEERDIMLVCLGWQHDARAWVDAYNRNRPVNKLHVVELRSDRKHGGIIRHEPLSASVTARREGGGAEAKLVVEVQDVVSPTIMQRLNLEQGVFRAQITDWRAVVDCILIDPQHDGAVFNVALADVPERKQDFVSGRYELPAPPAGSMVAIKIIDMLGEELVVSLPT
ncbi:MAG: site-specific DNA-methyltransferase [Burkholderiaceae bacterium]|nr:MAG: site-specific DNA-methyltransferase [Burkholderiaceae bacterium]